MWSRIRHRLNRLKYPVSVKLTMLYTAILLGILLFMSALMIGGTYVLLEHQAKNDINSSMQKVMAYLENGKAPGPEMLEQILLPSGMSLRVYDAKEQLILDSEPYAPGSRELRQPPHGRNHRNRGGINSLIDTITWDRPAPNHPGDEEAMVKQVRWTGQDLYYLEFRRDLSQPHSFLQVLTWSLIAVNLLGLLIAIFSGNYLSRKILQPLRDITGAAKEIEINHLDKRIDIKGSDDELKDLSITFNHMLDRIQSGVERQRRFISDASHELRTPITVIIGYANMLTRWGKEDPAALTEGIESIKSEAENMHLLIEKLLFLARTDKGKQVVNRTPVKLEKLIEEVARETMLIAGDHQVALDRNDDVTVWADEALLKQLLRIFIENSIKYTSPDGLIRICSQKSGPYAEITIKDNGVGIPPQDLSRIFDRFYRVDKARSKTTGGTGLGLSIAQWIAEQHQSEIHIDSAPGEGTTVRVRLPLE